MRQTMLDLMDALGRDIARTEAVADELVRAAAEMSAANLCHPRGVEALRATAIRQRVRELEMRGQLAALRETFAERFPLEL